MTEVASAEVPVFPTFQGFRRAVVSEVDASATEATRSFGDRFRSGVGGAMRGVGVAIGGALAVGAAGAGALIATSLSRGLDRALNIQDARAQLQGLGHDAASVDDIMTNALSSVRGTAFGLDQAATNAASAVAAGIAPGEALTRTLTLTADAAATARVGLGEMGSIVNKVATSGRLSTDVLNQFHDRGVPLLQMVAAEYGVTAEAAQEMVSKGEVSFERFQNALETNVGGAALASGNTARGAWANVLAALGRGGAMFTSGAVAGAPRLFQALSGAIDRAAESLAPLADELDARLEPAMARVATWLDTVDFGKVVSGARGLYDLVVGGNFSSALREAFGWEEDSGLVTFVLNVRDAISGLWNLVVGGDFTGALRNAFGWEEDSGFVTFVLGARQAVADFFSTLGSGDLGSAFGGIGTSLSTLGPAFAEFGRQLPAIGSASAELAASALPVLTGVLAFLAQHVDTLIAWMPAIVAGFVAWRVATVGTTAAVQANMAAQTAMLPVTLANNVARIAAANAERSLAVATGASTVATNAGVLANIRAAASTVAARVAMAAGAVATGVATAAQWALNAAMSANPIALVVIAIAALVAGLIWFFTQTQLGQEIWANFTRFLGEAWANVSTFVSEAWTNITTAVSDGINGVVEFVTGLPDRIMAALGDLGSLLFNSGRDLIDGFIGGIQDMIGGVTSAIGSVMDTVAGFFPNSPAKRGPFSGSGWTKLGRSGKATMDQWVGGMDPSAMDDLMRLPTGGRGATLLGGDDRAAAAGGGYTYAPTYNVPEFMSPAELNVWSDQQEAARRRRVDV